MTEQSPIAEVKGPNGTARIFEIMKRETRTIDYVVDFNGNRQTFGSMGEAYIEAGALTGTRT